jgi:DNA-binding transcriptional regulator YiaG
MSEPQVMSLLHESTKVRAALYAAPDSQALLAVLRNGLGLTQGLVATACGVSDRAVREWESGVTPRARHDARLRDLVDVVAELLGTMTLKGVQQWLLARNRRLGGTPVELLAAEQADAVLADIEALKAGDHV